MWSDFLTIWRLEWKRNRWLWLGAFALMLGGQGTLFLLRENLPEVLQWFPVGLAFLSPLFFASGMPLMIAKKQLPFFLTLPVGSRKIYWNYYSGSLLLCLTFASTLFLTQEFILRNLILGISLLLLAHAVMFWGGLLRRDGGGSVVGLLILFPLYLACYPLIQFLTALFAVLLFHSVEISLILHLLTGEDAPLPTLEYYITIPLIALAFALAFALAGASLWNKEVIRGRKGMKRTVWFTVLLLATPFLAAVLGYVAVSGTDCLLHDYWSRQPGFRSSEKPFRITYPEFYRTTPTWKLEQVPGGAARYVVDPEKVLLFCRRLQNETDTEKRAVTTCDLPFRLGYYNYIPWSMPYFTISDYNCFPMALKAFLEQKRWNDAKEILKCSELFFEYIHPQYFELLFTKLYLLRRELDVIYAGNEPEAASVMQVLLKQLEELSLMPPYLPDVRLPSNTGIFEIPKDISGDGSLLRRCAEARFRHIFYYWRIARTNREIRGAAQCVTPEELSRYVKGIIRFVTVGYGKKAWIRKELNPYVYTYYYLKVFGVAELRMQIAFLKKGPPPELPEHLKIENGRITDKITGYSSLTSEGWQ